VEPALKLAKAAGEISSVPPCAAVLEAAHPLPSKKCKDVIIAKFLSRNIKYIFHNLKGQYSSLIKRRLAPWSKSSTT